MRKSRREIIGAMAASGAVLASTAGVARRPGPHRPRPDPQGDRYRLRLSLRLRRPAAFLADAAEHAEPLRGLRVRQLQAQAGRGRACGGHQVLPRGPDRHAVGAGQYRSGDLPAICRPDQVRGRRVLVSRSPTLASRSTRPRPARMRFSNSCRPGSQPWPNCRPRASAISKWAELRAQPVPGRRAPMCRP